MNKISDKTIFRLTQYHSILEDCIKKGETNVTSSYMAKLLKIDDSQVRKDVSALNNAGKSRVGYDAKILIDKIEKTLGFSNPKSAFIVGAGNLGSALAKYNGFESYGLSVKALFDIDENKIATEINGKPIYNTKYLPEFLKDTDVEIAILTVPSAFAQDTADFIVRSNIKYIWNFSATILIVPDDVKVWNENLIRNFLQFSYQISS